jgi:Ca-activated chloride channel family protein
MLSGLSLAFPWALALLPLPLLLMRLLPAFSGQGGLIVPDGIASDLDAGSSLLPVAMRRLALAWIAWIGLVLAIAGPGQKSPIPALPASGRDIVLAIDMSGSMETRDFNLGGKLVSRVEAVKHVAADFIARRAGDRIGLVLFAETAYGAAPPSFDAAAVRETLETTPIGFVGRSTAIGDGLGMALKFLIDSKSPTRVVILLSDGSNNAGSVDPASAAQLAKDLGIRVHTIALGSGEIAATQETAWNGVDRETLRSIAIASGGKPYEVRSAEDLTAVYDEIEASEGGRYTAPPVLTDTPLWTYPAALAFAALLLGLGGRGRFV